MRQEIGFCTTSDGVRIAYARAGRGPPLLRVGGWLSHVEHDWRSPVWQPWLRQLGRDFSVARFDMRGTGLSDRICEEQGLDAWVRDVESVVDGMGWRRFDLLGMCQGGAIALRYAHRHPERVKRLVVYNSYANGAFSEGVPEHKRTEAETLGELIEVGWGRRSGAFREVFARLLSPRQHGEQIGWWEELQRITTSPQNACRLWRGFHEIDVRADLAAIRCPVLVAHVEGDAMVPFEMGRTLAAQLPEARFLPLSGDNHILQPDDAGWPPFFHELRSFLLDGPAGPESSGMAGIAELTRRERQVLDLVARGESNDELARKLTLTPKTVRNHVSNIMGKLGTTSRSRLIVQAREGGFGTD